MGRLGLILALGAALAIMVSGRMQKASAHAMLDHSEPPQDAKLAVPPAKITLFFTQGLKPSGSWVLLQDSGGGDVAVQVDFDPANNKVMSATPPTLAPGVYLVKWQSLSADDDDYAGGKFNLTVLKPDGSLPEGVGAVDSAAPPKKSAGGGSDLVLPAAAAAIAIVAVAGTVLVLMRKTS